MGSVATDEYRRLFVFVSHCMIGLSGAKSFKCFSVEFVVKLLAFLLLWKHSRVEGLKGLLEKLISVH